jgi:hypothetical protein
MEYYELRAADAAGLMHTTRDYFPSRAAALAECKAFFSEERTPGFGKFCRHGVRDEAEQERRFVEAWTCASCQAPPGPDFFWLVSDERWLAAVPKHLRKRVLCRPCFDRLESRAHSERTGRARLTT